METENLCRDNINGGTVLTASHSFRLINLSPPILPAFREGIRFPGREPEVIANSEYREFFSSSFVKGAGGQIVCRPENWKFKIAPNKAKSPSIVLQRNCHAKFAYLSLSSIRQQEVLLPKRALRRDHGNAL
ncbi:hypothetical protein NPIL_164911 [Nephila pilipes]|uniref:Uncharacterized protein n=1 Tax=Nephila pilipes TaxID=299642 RepID=A0A8X6NN57_NEPPI|nr:hypothetical protein NPIL_164911 [Nephila pilipes]